MLKFNVIPQCLRGTKHVQKAYIGVKTVRRTTTVSADQRVYFDDATLASAKPFKEMPSMMMLPYIGTSWIYLPVIGYDITRLHVAMKDKRRRLGDIFREKVGSFNIVFTHNADDMQTLYENEGLFPSRGDVASMRVYRESRKQWYSNTGLMILQGKEWWDLRSKTQRHLMKPKAIQAYLNPMQDVAKDLVDKIFKVRDANKEVPNFLGELYKWALESVALVGLDTRLGCLRTDLSPNSEGMKMINSIQTQFECVNQLEPFSGNIQFWKLFPTPTWKRLVAAADVFAEIAFKHINRSLEELKRTANEDKNLTLLQSMLMTKGLEVSGAMVTVADMIMAGIDTTSHSIGFFLYNMAKNPDKQELLYQEIKKLLPEKEDRITTDVFNELKYLKACMKEVQRLDPVAPGTARSLDHDVVLSGYRVPAGTFIIIYLQEMNRDEKYFSNPNQFLPERWTKKDEKFHRFSFLPFGIGTRSCIGRRLAELEMICLLTHIIRRFKIEYHHEDIGIITRLVNTPDKPLRFNFIDR